MAKDNHLKTQVELARYQRKAELLGKKLEELVTKIPVPASKLKEVYDPEDPTPTENLIAQHKAELEAEYKRMVEEADAVVEAEINKKFDTSKIELEDKVSTWAESNKLKDITLEDVMQKVPPIITNKLKEAKDDATIVAVLEDAKTFLSMDKQGTSGGVYTPTTPHDHQAGSSGGTSGGTPPTTDNDTDDEMY